MHTKKGTSGTKVSGPAALTPQWVYDALMEIIEPDLMTKNLPNLETMVDGETAQEKTERFKSYTEAFKLLDECLDELEPQIKEMCALGMHDIKHMEKQTANANTRDMLASVGSLLDFFPAT